MINNFFVIYKRGLTLNWPLFYQVWKKCWSLKKWGLTLIMFFSITFTTLKGLFRKNERVYRMKPENLRRWTIHIRHLFDVSVSRNWYKTVSKYAILYKSCSIKQIIFHKCETNLKTIISNRNLRIFILPFK